MRAQMTSGAQVDTRYLRKMPSKQQEVPGHPLTPPAAPPTLFDPTRSRSASRSAQMQRQSIEKMREDAKNRTPTENIEAAMDAMEKFYGALFD